MASNIISPFGLQLEDSVGDFDLRSWMENFDLQKFVKDLDLKTFAFLSLIVIAIIFLADLVPKTFSPFGRSLAVSAADVWQRNRDLVALDASGRAGRTLEPVIEVLDSLAEAARKWEEPQEKVTTHRSS
ncbi:uncharacterized protein [Macrobrachium rosenbergii]|uniref:uncharacterized protein n=1 Tax=Macrobrachium rosenbergii TaxID=79674 RepID=UPI0034D48326